MRVNADVQEFYLGMTDIVREFDGIIESVEQVYKG